MKYYSVVCEMGHQGARRQKTCTFYFEANNSCEAMDKGKSMPGVKHSRMPLSIREINEDTYNAGRITSAYERV